MKKIAVISFIIFTMSIAAKGQITKGNWLVGGIGKLYSYNEEYNSFPPPGYQTKWKYTEIGISGSVGYFLLEKLALGLRPGFASIKGHSIQGNITQNQKKYFVGPFGRYYLLNDDKPFNLITDLSYQLGVNNASGETGKVSNFSAMCGPVLFFNTTVGMEFLFGYSLKKEDIKDVRNQTQKGFEIAIAFQIHLEKE